jgi:coiled-coil domain-containing protein 55
MKALQEDRNVFDYDEVYDQMQNEKRIQTGVHANPNDKTPKYVSAIMQKAAERKRYRDIVFERKLQKEAKKDEELYERSEKFVTSAYKQKLLERQQWEEEENIRASKEDITKKKDMMDFYRNLLTKNVAYGASSNTNTIDPSIGFNSVELRNSTVSSKRKCNFNDDRDRS